MSVTHINDVLSTLPRFKPPRTTDCAKKNKLDIYAPYVVRENCLMRESFMKGLVPFGAGLVIVLLFVHHPSVNAYHAGLAGWLVSAIFLASVVVGARTGRIYILSALIILSFVEPGVKITNSLHFDIVSNGLLIGAGTAWLLGRPRIAASSMPILAAIAGIATLTLVVPAIFRSVEWIDIHDALMFGKYALIVVLAFATKSSGKMWLVIAGSIALGSALVAVFAILQTFHIPVINTWIFSTYLPTRDLPDAELAHLTTSYLRAYGVGGPTGSAMLLAMSIGAWLVLLMKADSFWRVVAVSAGMSSVLIAVFLMSSRLGVLVVVPVLLMGISWINAGKRNRPLMWTSSSTFVFMLLLVVGLAFANASFGDTVKNSKERFTSTIPNLLRGQPDESVRDRIDEYAQLDLMGLRYTGVRGAPWSNEYFVLLDRFGLAGLLLVWLFWLMLLARSLRATVDAMTESDRLLGFVALTVVLSTIMAAVGNPTILEPGRMTVVLVTIGVVPALGAMVPKRLSTRLEAATANA